MEQCSPFSWIFYNEEEEMMGGDMRQYILQSRMELEATVLAAQEEIMKKEEELIHMKDLLMLTIKERDEAQSKFHKVMLEKLLLQQQFQQHLQSQLQPPPQTQPEKQQQQQQQKAAAAAAVTFSLSKANTTTKCFSSSSSESEESSIISSSPTAAAGTSPALQQQLTLPPQIAAKLASSRRPLPEKGKLLKAVMEAGPLLQTLLLAGPLPQWQHPPPQLNTIEIPPVTISSSTSPRKRGVDNFDCSMISSPKYQRVV